MASYLFLTQGALEQALLEERSYKGLNSNPFEFPRFHVAAWKTDGSIGLADITNPDMMKLIGVSYAAIPSNQRGLIVQRGILKGAIEGLGATAGATIYLGLVAGSLVKTPPVGQERVEVGFAERNPETNLVTDLRLADFVTHADDNGTGGGTGGGGLTADEVRDIVAYDQSHVVLNNTGTTIQNFRAVAWGPDQQSVVPGNALDSSLCDIIGITTAAIAHGEYGPVRYTGIIEGIMQGSGALPGMPVFLAEGGQGTLTLSAPESNIVQVGYAVPRKGTPGPATDLLLSIQRIST